MSPQGVERRLAAILAADVAGYSRLMGVDEAGTLAQLNAHRAELIDPAITGHQGRIVKTIGDGLLVEFPSIVDAVRCAIHIQKGMAERQAGLEDEAKMLWRIGVNVGDIIVEGSDIHGDGVNVASRLEGLADPGGIVVSGDAFRQIKNKLDVGFEDLGEQRVKNIADPVSVYRVLTGAAAGTLISARKKGALRWIGAAAALVAVAAVVLVWNFAVREGLPRVEAAAVDRMAYPLPDKPSIVVLPFDNLSGDPEQKYFADGLTDDLITGLSKLSGLFVISRNTAFTYKERDVRVKDVAEELGVRYVLDGSVRREGAQVRINAQLVDATTGRALWAETFNGGASDIFALQDEINAKVVSAMAVELTGEEQQVAQVEQTKNVLAYEALLQGVEHLRRDTAEDTGAAVSFFRRAIELDPTYSQAYTALASAYWKGWQNGWFKEVGAASLEEAQQEASAMLKLAMANGPTSDAYSLDAEMAMQAGESERAVELAQHSVAMAPSKSENQARLGRALAMAGRPSEALDHFEHAVRRNPSGQYLAQFGLARFSLGEYEKAAVLFERLLEEDPKRFGMAAPLAAAYGHLGREDEAQAALKRLTDGVQISRGATPGTNAQPRVSDIVAQFAFRRPQDRERLAEGLRKAGLPE